ARLWPMPFATAADCRPEPVSEREDSFQTRSSGRTRKSIVPEPAEARDDRKGRNECVETTKRSEHDRVQTVELAPKQIAQMVELFIEAVMSSRGSIQRTDAFGPFSTGQHPEVDPSQEPHPSL